VTGRDSSFDFLSQATKIVKEASNRRITLRMSGAIAIREHCPSYRDLHATLGRELSDIDLVGYRREESQIDKLFNELGYTKHLSVAMMIGGRRVYIDPASGHAVDIFLDKLVMCHTVDFTGRLDVDYPTVPLAEIFLSKMQIVELTEKDVKDLIVLLREHEVGVTDRETVNARYVANILSDDWGFYYTVTTNLMKVKELLPKYNALTEGDKTDVTSKIDKILRVVEGNPKSLKWKMRASVGTKKIWYKKVDVR